MSRDSVIHIVKKLILLGGFFISIVDDKHEVDYWKSYFPGKWLDNFPKSKIEIFREKYRSIGHSFICTDIDVIAWGYIEDLDGVAYIIGPVSERRLSRKEVANLHASYDFGDKPDFIPVIYPKHKFATFLSIFEALFNDKTYKEHEIILGDSPQVISSQNYITDVMETIINGSENDQYNTSFWETAGVIEGIKHGNVEQVYKNLDITYIERAGHVSTDPLKREEYLLVIAIHDIGMAAIDGGLYPNEANRIADYYLRKLSEIGNGIKRYLIVKEAAITCAQAVAKRRNEVGHKYIVVIREYVLTHITQKIKISSIAMKLDISESYLSRMFHENTGTHLSQYIINQKLEASTIFLKHTDKKISEISNFFAFCNQSYYTQQFQKYYKISPSQYRQNYNIPNYNPAV